MSKRDIRVDALRGLALFMIFVDHIPHDSLNWLTLHNFGFCDAAEIFVLLAGFSSFMAYGKRFEQAGAASFLRRIVARCLRIYAVHVALLLLTMLIAWRWTLHFSAVPHFSAMQGAGEPILEMGFEGLGRALALQALPGYLDILPLYIVLLGVFPLIYLVMRGSAALALVISASIWLAANQYGDLNLPNWVDTKGWYFNPFAWQFLFTIGACLALAMKAGGGVLPRRGWLVAACCAYLGFAFLQGAPWADWHLPSLRLFAMDLPDKSHLSPLRILDILALIYLILSSRRLGAVMRTRVAAILALCGKNSLEVFAASCLLALFGRLIFRTYGSPIWLQVLVNAVGFAGMVAVGLAMERVRQRASRPASPGTAFPTGSAFSVVGSTVSIEA